MEDALRQAPPWITTRSADNRRQGRPAIALHCKPIEPPVGNRLWWIWRILRSESVTAVVRCGSFEKGSSSRLSCSYCSRPIPLASLSKSIPAPAIHNDPATRSNPRTDKEYEHAHDVPHTIPHVWLPLVRRAIAFAYLYQPPRPRFHTNANQREPRIRAPPARP